jgi:uncharacterized membrane protein
MLTMLVSIGLIFSVLGFPLLLVGLIMLLVKAIKKTSKKSALIIILISILLIASGFALSAIDTDSIEQNDIMQKAESEVESMIYAEYISSMVGGDIKNITVNYTTKKADGNEYTLYGKYTILDNYNEKYVGKFEISLTYIETHEDGSVSFEENFVNIGVATKEK